MDIARIPFSADDEQAIRMLNGSMLAVLVFHFLFGALLIFAGGFGFLGVPQQFQFHPASGVGTVISALGMLASGLLAVGQGALLAQVRSSLVSVLSTDTNDQAYLSIAFSRLKLFFMLEAAVFVLMMGVSAGGFLTQAFGPSNPLLLGAGL